MTKIVILSDTHGNVKLIEKLYPILSEADMILFAGDGELDFMNVPEEIFKKLKAVKGNCDHYYGDKELIIKVEDKTIFLTHGHLYGVKCQLNALKLKAQSEGADIVVYGHNHTANICEVDNLLMINPGTLYPYSDKLSYCYLVIHNNKATATIVDCALM